jgi:transcription elongation factor
MKSLLYRYMISLSLPVVVCFCRYVCNNNTSICVSLSAGNVRFILQDPLEFPANELKKFFKMGDHVKVISGRYEGDTGLIVRVEDNIVVLFSDLTMHEVS